MREPRTAVMILVEASWEDPSGGLQTVPARMEDKSAGGACIRLGTRIGVGSRLKIRWRWDQFAGIVKYCRAEGEQYLVGIQREMTNDPILRRTVLQQAAPTKTVISNDPPDAIARICSSVKQGQRDAIPAAGPKVENVAGAGMSNGSAATPQRELSHATDMEKPSIPQPCDCDALRPIESRTKQPPQANEGGKERKRMRHKWLELVRPHEKYDGTSRTGNGNGNGACEKTNGASGLTSLAENTSVDQAGDTVAGLEMELLSIEDIYRAAGINHSQRGYSIHKVIEMLHSDHIRSLSAEMRRSAVLMALDAAGITIEEVLQDAKVRREALDSYEAEQRKQVEAEWSRKAEENIQIQAELERVKAQYMARINRNVDWVNREKAKFSGWLTMKQQACQSMSEAAELCSKPKLSPTSAGSISDASMAGVSAKPM